MFGYIFGEGGKKFLEVGSPLMAKSNLLNMKQENNIIIILFFYTLNHMKGIPKVDLAMSAWLAGHSFV